jgi:hypothetical protein
MKAMIKDDVMRHSIREDWGGVRKLRQHESQSVLIPGAGVVVGSSLPDAFWNLPFLLAYSVLDVVLTALRDEGNFECKSRMLGQKMEASRARLPWQNYDVICEGKDARNRLAHEAELLPKKKCFEYIDSIELELAAWALL